MLDFGILRLVSWLMKCLCIAPPTPAMIVMRGFVFHLLFCMLLIKGLYLVYLYVRACSGNLSWKYVKSMNCIYVGVGSKGVDAWFGAPNTPNISSLNLAWHWQFVCGHVHFMSHYGTVCSWFM